MKVDTTKNYYMVEVGPKGLNDKVITLKPTRFQSGTFKKEMGEEYFFEAVEEDFDFMVWADDLKPVMDNQKDFDGDTSDEGYKWFVFETKASALQTLRALRAYRNHVRGMI